MSIARTLRIALPLVLSGFAAQGHAATAYDEATSGDLSNGRGSPTSIAVVAGDNDIFGTTGTNSGLTDLDYFTVDIPTGAELTAVTVLPGTSVNGSFSFIGVQGGSTMTVSPTSFSPAGLLGWTHYSGDDIGTNILGAIGSGFGIPGFTGPLPAGPYTFWIQDTAPGNATYGFRLTVAVPEPGTWAMALVGLGMVGGTALRRARRA